ncbi:NHL repeat-containing protein [Candidatus Poribacteria bacterium]
MQRRIFGFIQFLILLIFLLPVGSDTVRSEIGDVPLQLEEEPAEEIAKYLFGVEGFSEEQKFSAPMGIFYDKHNNEIYVADTRNNQVDIFDSEGQPLFQIRSEQGLKAPLDVLVDAESQIYVSHIGKNALQLFNFRGEHLEDLYAPDETPFSPGRLCFDSQGNLYVVDKNKAEILVYDPAGDFKFRFGGRGKGEGKFRMISGIAVDSAGQICVADSRQASTQIFDNTGHFLLSFGGRGVRDSEFSFPGGICIDEKDRIWVVDAFKHQVKVFGTDGTFLFQFGVFGPEPGQLFFPIDLALDGKGRAYILEKGASRLQAFEINGW